MGKHEQKRLLAEKGSNDLLLEAETSKEAPTAPVSDRPEDEQDAPPAAVKTERTEDKPKAKAEPSAPNRKFTKRMRVHTPPKGSKKLHPINLSSPHDPPKKPLDGTGDETNTADEDNKFWKELAKDNTFGKELEAAYVKDEQ